MVMLLTSCSKNESDALVSKVYFTNWNQCEALNTLKAYVEDVTDPKSANFIKEEDRIATFDMDGTFLAELYPTYFENTVPSMTRPIVTRHLRMCARRHLTSGILCVRAFPFLTIST